MIMIETPRLVLRPFKESDLDDLYEYLSEITIHCFMDMKTENRDDAAEILKERLGDNNYFAIELKETGKVIGEIFAHPEGTDPSESVKDTFSPCWMLNERYQNKGYMTEAARAYITYLFEKCGARRVYAYTEDYNLSCQKLLEKLGFRREGLYKEFVSFVNDEQGNPIYENTYEYAVLKKEWKPE
ncbi:GNAT family N-acetyltransferase [Treponema sp.]|uniref:GNAT family N-acetyltransferase n=1 Tax=Treponema sp. TaxID=166 RepID=UPI00298E6B8B|nr:GNAT family N-acetyltransferase [Treponema sp.]MCR5614203.1 GNAT family N-acetyltransferase [Treponema sp.]